MFLWCWSARCGGAAHSWRDLRVVAQVGWRNVAVAGAEVMWQSVASTVVQKTTKTPVLPADIIDINVNFFYFSATTYHNSNLE